MKGESAEIERWLKAHRSRLKAIYHELGWNDDAMQTLLVEVPEVVAADRAEATIPPPLGSPATLEQLVRFHEWMGYQKVWKRS